MIFMVGLLVLVGAFPIAMGVRRAWGDGEARRLLPLLAILVLPLVACGVIFAVVPAPPAGVNAPPYRTWLYPLGYGLVGAAVVLPIAMAVMFRRIWALALGVGALALACTLVAALAMIMLLTPHWF
jgi:hypothetical protein